MKPFSRDDEIILKPTTPLSSYQTSMTSACGSVRMNPMVEAVAALLVLFSAGIFLAHVVDAYHAQ